MGELPLIELLTLTGGFAALLLFARWVRARSRINVAQATLMPQGGVPALAVPSPLTESNRRFERMQGENPWFRRLRLDAAAPNKVVVHKPFELIVAVRWPSSPGMSLGRTWQNRSPNFRAAWKEGKPSIDLIIEVQASGCYITGENFRVFPVYADDDAPDLNFILTPAHVGEHIIHVTVRDLVYTLGSVRFQVPAYESVRESYIEFASEMMATNVAYTLLASWQPLYDILMRAFSMDEMRSLCLRMGIDFDDIPGSKKSTKFGELMGHCQRRGQLGKLVAHLLAERPNLRGYFPGV